MVNSIIKMTISYPGVLKYSKCYTYLQRHYLCNVFEDLTVEERLECGFCFKNKAETFMS